MKSQKLTVVVSVIILVIFVLLLFVFQVRTTEVAVKTTFGNPAAVYTEPNAYFKWPWPIQKVYKFDKRIQNLEDQLLETPTEDGYNILTQLYLGWRIQEPKQFLTSFEEGSIDAAERTLTGLVQTEKNAVIGNHPFAHFISADEKVLQLTNIEHQILKRVQGTALERYGVGVEFLGIKKLNLPQSVTTNVFARMQAERQKEVDRLNGEAEEQSIEIRSEADRQREEILAKAEAEAMQIRGQGDAEAAQYYEVFSKNPELAVLIMKLNSLEQTLQERSTLILDQQTPPFDLLKGKPVREKADEIEISEN